MFADVIIDIQHEKLDKIFQYRVPESMADELEPGMEVLVPFGRGSRQIKGYVIGLTETCDYDLSKVKDIMEISRTGVEIEAKLIALAAWMKENYGGTMIQALKTVLPIKQKENAKVKKRLRLLLDRETGERQLRYYLEKHQKARARLLAALLDDTVLEYDLVTKKLNITAPVIRALEEQRVLAVESEQVYRNPVKLSGARAEKIVYTQEQQRVISAFCKDYMEGTRRTYLIHGVTGSGKTEVYMEMIRTVVDMGKQAIVLIPEIALTYQTVMRFYRRFGDRVSIMNSRLSSGERYDQMMRARSGQVDVMIGPRSALFTPFPNLGLIVIDEEHEPTYKSEQTPRYHARDVAAERARLCRAALVLGSATPSMEAYTKAMAGEYKLLSLKNRAASGSALSSVDVVDLRKEMQEGNKSMFSRRLKELIEDRLRKKEQIMLFINRRGYSNFISCRSCGEAVKCPHCDVSLTLHGTSRLVCHYCGYSVPLMKLCPSCGSPYIAGFGAGTQKLEELTGKAFPQARILRMDADTTARKGGHEEILAAFSAHEADILIGTQMIVKGHDFGNVTLVGIMAADLSLNTPDYRCSERTFQLLTQAAGRAGRGSLSGNVVIQTYQPEHYAIVTAAEQNYEEFYRREMLYRKMMNYPPACYMEAVLFAGNNEKTVERCSDLALLTVRKMGYEENEIQMIGPVRAPVYKVNDIYRKILYIKSKNCDILDKIRRNIELLAAGDEGFKSLALQFDIS